VSPNCRDRVGVGSYKIETYPDVSVNGCETGSSYDQVTFVTAENKPNGYIHLQLANAVNIGLDWTEERNIKLCQGNTDRNPVKVIPKASSGATGEFNIEIYHSTSTKYPSNNYFSNRSPSEIIPIKIDIV